MHILLKVQETPYIYELSTANFVHLQFKHANKHWLYIYISYTLEMCL